MFAAGPGTRVVAGNRHELGEFAARLTPDGSQLVFTSDRAFQTRQAGLYQVWTVDTADLIEAGYLQADDLNR